MQHNFSNEIKVTLYAGNIEEDSGNLRKEDLTTVISYSYDCQRSRDSKGLPVGTTKSLYLNLTLRNFSHKLSRHFLKEISRNEPYDYTILFNAIFDDNKILKEYEDLLVARAYVVDIEEIFDNYESENTKVGQKLMKLKLLLTKLIFNEENCNNILTISND